MKEPLILGGGLAGLSAGYHSNGTIFEKESNVGGHARSKYKNGLDLLILNVIIRNGLTFETF